MTELDRRTLIEGNIYSPEPFNHYKAVKKKNQEQLDKLKSEDSKYSEDEILSNKDPYTVIKIRQQDELDELKNVKVRPPVDDDCGKYSLSKYNTCGIVGLESYEGSELITSSSLIYDNTILAVEPYEMVDHPQHYGGKDNPYEAIKVIEAWDLNFNLGSALKYISRKNKPDASLDDKHKRLEDLKKAAWYISREVERFAKEIGEVNK